MAVKPTAGQVAFAEYMLNIYLGPTSQWRQHASNMWARWINYLRVVAQALATGMILPDEGIAIENDALDAIAGNEAQQQVTEVLLVHEGWLSIRYNDPARLYRLPNLDIGGVNPFQWAKVTMPGSVWTKIAL
jgi:hypothetical protein